jgi:hypothetical protein
MTPTRTPPWDSSAVTSDRHWTAPAAGLLAIGVAICALSSCGSSRPSSTLAEEANTAAAEYDVSEWGVRVGIRVAYGEPRTVTGARLVTADSSVDASLYPLDGTDPDAPTTVSLAPGVEVSIEGYVLVACSGAPDLPVFEVVSRANGLKITELFAPADEAGYLRAVDEWCDRPFTMNVTGSRATPEGDHTLYVEFSNPGLEPVRVTSAQFEDDDYSWEEATVVVPAGSIERMAIHGHGPQAQGCVPDPPWESGHLRADGEVIEPNGSGATTEC